MLSAYDLSVRRTSANELAARIVEELPKLAVDGEHTGVGIAALMIAIREMLNVLEPTARAVAVRGVIAYFEALR